MTKAWPSLSRRSERRARSAGRGAAASTARRVAPSPNGTTSIGSGKRPSIGTHLLSSAITTMRAEAAATIFSRSSAPPPPLIRVRSGAISSAPSTVRSSSGVSSSVVSGTPSRSASRRVASEVGTPTTRKPAAHPLGQQLDEMPRGRAGAEAEPHARPHEFERAGGGGYVSALRCPWAPVWIRPKRRLSSVDPQVSIVKAWPTAARGLPLRVASDATASSMTLHPIVVFDLDGTLVDTAPDLVETLNVVFAREGLPPVAYETARNMVGGGARLMIERGLAAEGRTPARRGNRSAVAAISSPTTPTTSPTAPGRSRASRQRSTSSPARAAASRSAPTSSNGCRCGCSTRSALSRAASPRSAARTRSAFRSPTRRSCAAPSSGRRRHRGGRSWWEIPAPISPPPAPPVPGRRGRLRL